MMKKLLVFIVVLVIIESSFATTYNSGMKNIQISISEQRQKGLKQGNEPFIMGNENDKAGILLLHGFTASPWEVKELAEYLNKDNITVYGTLLAGHGTSPRDLKKTKWEDWYKSSGEGLLLLS